MAVTQPKLPPRPHDTAPVLAGSSLTPVYAAFFRDLLAYCKALEQRLTDGGL